MISKNNNLGFVSFKGGKECCGGLIMFVSTQTSTLEKIEPFGYVYIIEV